MTNRITASETFRVSPGDAWEKSRELSRAVNYKPVVVKVEISTQRQQGVGARRRVCQSGGRWFDEALEAWRDGEGSLLRRQHGVQPVMALRKARFHYRIEPGGSEHTLMTTSLIYEFPLCMLGWLVDRLAFRRILRGMMREPGLGIKRYHETGRAITPERPQDYKVSRR